jgi:NAD(P) transhydrogenase subunit alpha
MVIGLLKEKSPEKRVALLPEGIAVLKSQKSQVLVEHEAGKSAWFSDDLYKESGATFATTDEIIQSAGLLLCINIPEKKLRDLFKPGTAIVATFNPLTNKDIVKELKEKGITSFSLDTIPRNSRAQAMDVLSSMATVAGYRAILDAAFHLPSFFPMFMSAAGTIKPAKVLVLGAGVAGLQAIATARKLGAVVEAFDVRSAVKEEVQSLGAKFVEVEGAIDDKTAGGYAVEQTEEFKQKQSQLIQDHAIKSDVVICTAQIPGRTAPVLLKKESLEKMKPGSVIVDLAASSGGNCEMTENNKTIEYHGVTIIGNSAYAADMSIDASRMYGKNLINFLKLLIDNEGNLNLNFEDEIIKESCITHNGEIINEKVKSLILKQK